MPRNFLHRPLPYILCNRLRTRIRRPTAMGSIAVISPIISKSMRPQPRRSALGPNFVYSIHQHRCMCPPDARKTLAVGGSISRRTTPWFRIYHAERWVGQALPLLPNSRAGLRIRNSRHLVGKNRGPQSRGSALHASCVIRANAPLVGSNANSASAPSTVGAAHHAATVESAPGAAVETATRGSATESPRRHSHATACHGSWQCAESG